MFRLIFILPLILILFIGCGAYPSVDVIGDDLGAIYFKLNAPIYFNSQESRKVWLETLRVYSKCPPYEDMWYVTSMWPTDEVEPLDNRQDLDFHKIQYGKTPPGFYSPNLPKKLKPGCVYYVSAGYLNRDHAEAIFVCDENGCSLPIAEKLKNHKLGSGMPKFDCGSCE